LDEKRGRNRCRISTARTGERDSSYEKRTAMLTAVLNHVDTRLRPNHELIDEGRKSLRKGVLSGRLLSKKWEKRSVPEHSSGRDTTVELRDVQGMAADRGSPHTDEVRQEEHVASARKRRSHRSAITND